MNKTIKYIIITVVAIAVLAGGLVALLMTAPQEEKEPEQSSSSATEEKSVIVEKEDDDIASVEVKNAKGEMFIERTPATEDEKYDSYVFVGYENYKSTANVRGAVEALTPLKSVKDVGKSTDLAGYGLVGEESVEITINYTDGTKDEIVVGSKATSTFGNYVLKGDEIYIAVINDVFFESIGENIDTYFYDATLYDTSNNATDPSILEINFSGTAFEEGISIKYDEELEKKIMTAPFDVYVAHNSDRLGDLAKTVQALELTDVAYLNATEEDLIACGLDNPMATIDFKVNYQEHTLSVSEQVVDGKRYIIADGDTTTIYRVRTSVVDPWATTTLANLRSGIMYLVDIASLEKIDVDYNGYKLGIGLSRVKNEETSTEEYDMYDYSAKVNGKDVAYKDVTTQFYVGIAGIANFTVDEYECEENPTLSVTYTTYDGEVNTIKYFKAVDQTLYCAYLNGSYIGTARDTSIDVDFDKALEAYKLYFED